LTGTRPTLVPSGRPPHKALSASYEDRLAMTRLAAEPDGFPVSDCERGATTSYSFDTLMHFPEPRLFVIGADAFSELESWYRWRDVVSMTGFIVVSRPGREYRIPHGADVQRLDTLALDVSSSAIREALGRGEQPDALPPAVAGYIREHRLYGWRAQSPAG
jgi:nicotinate-nucleotide adenylyltransferase